MPELGQLPLSIRQKSRWLRLAGVPALIVHPDGNLPEVANGTALAPAPAIIWMHGRTANKEIDPGRFLRLARAGIGVVALDLPGHGERAEAHLTEPQATLEVVERMANEIDAVVDAAVREGPFDRAALAIGGFSAGGMAALVRLCRPHHFRAAILEATTGDWRFQHHRAMHDPQRVAALNPIEHLEAWAPIPLLILHAELDAWVSVEGQRTFVRALVARGIPQELIEFHAFPQTGAPAEHIGFGRYASQAKDLGAAFLERQLRRSL